MKSLVKYDVTSASCFRTATIYNFLKLSLLPKSPLISLLKPSLSFSLLFPSLLSNGLSFLKVQYV